MSPVTGNISDDHLRDLLMRQDEKAIEVIYDKYGAALYGVVLRIVRSEEIAADVLQDSFVKIWKNTKSYDPAKGRLFTWLLNIARNTAIDVVRSKAFKRSGNMVSVTKVAISEPNVQLNVREDHIGVKELVQKLRPEYRQVIDILYFSGYTQAEAAEELGLPLGTVKTRARAAVLQLRELFGI